MDLFVITLARNYVKYQVLFYLHIDFVLEFIGDIIDFFDSRKKRKSREKDKIVQTDVPEENGYEDEEEVVEEYIDITKQAEITDDDGIIRDDVIDNIIFGIDDLKDSE